MSANNKRVRRIIVDILWEYGAMTKEGMAAMLSKTKNIRTVPSPHSLSALLSKNPQIVQIGSTKVENAIGTSAYHLVYDINRKVIKSKEDIMLTRSPTVMTPAQMKEAEQCSCGKIRIFPVNETRCLHCIRKEQ